MTILMVLVLGCFAVMAATQNNDANIDDFKLITGITVSEDEASAHVYVSASRLLTFTSVKQPSPLGLILYFPKTVLDKNRFDAEITPESDTLGIISASELTQKGHTAKIVITLKQDVPYTTRSEGNGIEISFKKPLRAGRPEAPESVKVAALGNRPIIAATPAATRLESVYALRSGNGVKIKLIADGQISEFKQFTAQNPARIVFDIFNIKQNRKKEQLVPVNSKWVKSVRYYGHPDKLRLVLDTKDRYLATCDAQSVQNGLLIRVGNGHPPQAVLSQKPASAKQVLPAAIPHSTSGIRVNRLTAMADKPVAIAKTEKSVIVAKAADTNKPILMAKTAASTETNVSQSAPQSPAWVNRIDFSSEEAGKSTLIIGTSQPVKYTLKKVAQNRLQLTLQNTRLPDYRKRPLVTTRFESAIDRVLPFEAPALRNTSLFSIEMREAVPYFVEQTDKLLMVHFEASSVPPKSLEMAKLPSWKKVVDESAMITAQAPTAEEKVSVSAEAPVQGMTKVFTGEKIALDFYETDIKNVFRILREVSKKNFAIDKGVEGKVTLTLETPVPWDQVLDLILKMNGLGMTFEGDIIRIAKRATLDKEEQARKKKIAEQRKLIRAEEKEEKEETPLITEYIAINYASANTEVLPKIKPILTKNRGKISVDERNNQLIITDVPENIEKAKSIVRKIDQVTPQVLIEARIVEATNSFSRAVGVDWGISGQSNTSLSNHLGGSLAYGLSATNPPTSSLGAIGITFSRITGTPFDIINATLAASETQGDLNIISAPKILTLSNKKATITQGVRYPYNKLVDGETRTEFINVDLKLEVEPLVTPDKRIAMKLFVSNNEIGAFINNAQSFTTKEANTELLVNDGETVVIGGIRKTTKRKDISGVPVFKDMPVIGWLFKSKGVTDNKEELLIFITPQNRSAQTARLKTAPYPYP